MQNKFQNNSEAMQFEAQLEAIAKEHCPTITTLKTQNSGEDFKEVAVWGLKAALEAAYQAGLDYANRVNKTLNN